MDAMLGAIKARKSKDVSPMEAPVEAAPEAAPAQGQNVLHALVMQLSPNQKQELMSLLAQSQNADVKGIEKGEPSPTEQAAIAAEAEGEGDPEEVSEIGASMVDRQAERMAEGNAKPRNLGERARMNAAKKLKSKGK